MKSEKHTSFSAHPLFSHQLHNLKRLNVLIAVLYSHKCLLFTTGDFREEDGQFVPEWASCIYCYYVILMAATLILICLMQAVRTMRFIKNDTDT